MVLHLNSLNDYFESCRMISLKKKKKNSNHEDQDSTNLSPSKASTICQSTEKPLQVNRLLHQA